MPPLRACRDKSDPTRTTVLRKTHGRSIPSTTPAGLRPTAPASARQAAVMSIVRARYPRQKSHPRPVKRDFRGTEHMPPPTSNRETRRYIYNRALKTHRAKFTKKGLYLRVLRAWFPYEIHRVLSRTITLQSVINNSGLAISPRMRPRIRSTAVGAVHSRRESMVVSGICRYCDSSMLSNPIT